MESLQSMKERLNYLQIEFAIVRTRSKEALAMVENSNKQLESLFNEFKTLGRVIDEHPDNTPIRLTRPLIRLEHEALTGLLNSVLDGLETYVKEHQND